MEYERLDFVVSCNFTHLTQRNSSMRKRCKTFSSTQINLSVFWFSTQALRTKDCHKPFGRANLGSFGDFSATIQDISPDFPLQNSTWRDQFHSITLLRNFKKNRSFPFCWWDILFSREPREGMTYIVFWAQSSLWAEQFYFRIKKTPQMTTKTVNSSKLKWEEKNSSCQ